MGQRATTGAHADGSNSLVGATTEFEPDVINLLVATLRRAVRSELPAVGTDTLLGELVAGDTDAGEAIAPGMRKAGSLGGLIRALSGGGGWVSDDEVSGASAAGGADEEARQEADEVEVEAAWREAWWRFGLTSRGSAASSGRVRPGMTGGMRACLLLALRSARAEGTISVRCRHVARALLDLPDTRAREALLLERLDLAAAATALDGLDASASAETEGPESSGVALLRRAGTLGKSGNRLTRAFASWTSGSAANGSPVVFAVTTEGARQAIRCGRAQMEPVDLLLGILALDRALSVAGRSLPARLADANAAAALMRRHGVRQVSLVSAAVSAEVSAAVPSASASASVPPSAAVPDSDSAGAGAGAGPGASDSDGVVWPSAAAGRVMAVARLSAAEHGSPTVGTVHLLSALLDETETETEAEGETESEIETETESDAGAGTRGLVARLLAAGQVDVAALRAELSLRLGA
jgi:hypothetical protein